MNPVRSFRGAEARQEVMSAPSGSVSTLVKNFVTRLQTASSWKPTFIKKIGKWMNIYSDTTTNSSLTHTQPDLKTLSWSLFVFVSLPGWSPECEQEDNRRGPAEICGRRAERWPRNTGEPRQPEQEAREQNENGQAERWALNFWPAE